MSCRELLAALRDHAAGAEATPNLAAHLRHCPACADALEAKQRLMAEINAALGDVRHVEPSPAFLGRARSLAEAHPSPRRIAPQMWAAAAVLLLAFSALVLQRAVRAPAESPVPPTLAPLAEASPTPPPARPAATGSSSLSARSARPTPVGLPLVPPGQEAALVRFAELMTSGVLAVPAQLLDPEASSAPIPEPPDLDRPLLNIEPIEAYEAPSEE